MKRLTFGLLLAALLAGCSATQVTKYECLLGIGTDCPTPTATPAPTPTVGS